MTSRRGLESWVAMLDIYIVVWMFGLYFIFKMVYRDGHIDSVDKTGD